MYWISNAEQRRIPTD
jgi:hypothetical protein